MSTNYSSRFHFYDAYDNANAVGQLVFHNVSDTVEWRVNGERRATFGKAELRTLVKAFTEDPRGKWGIATKDEEPQP